MRPDRQEGKQKGYRPHLRLLPWVGAVLCLGCGCRGGRRQRGAAELSLVDELYDEFVARLVEV